MKSDTCVIILVIVHNFVILFMTVVQNNKQLSFLQPDLKTHRTI